MQAVALRISGTIQGVGFRPFIWQLAQRYQLTGDVCNDGQGVLVRLYPQPDQVDFEQSIRREAPPLARIGTLQWTIFDWEHPPNEFTIRTSAHGNVQTHIPPDTATCPDCLAEISDPTARYYQYPFTTCTHCGPRFSVIRALPYDREQTSLHDFPLCQPCYSDYVTPSNRRFHAESSACPDCGPQLFYQDGNGRELQKPLERAISALNEGAILLIKGIGGFHLVTDASNAQNVARLRLRKQRLAKPFAVLVRDKTMAMQCVQLDPGGSGHTLLAQRAAPIVLLPKRSSSIVADNVAPDLDELGVCYPATPLHHLLSRGFGRPLIFTSANRSSQAPLLDDDLICKALRDIADGMLGHNRAIVTRVDDSVVKWTPRQPVMLRRSRGYVPENWWLDESYANEGIQLAMGGDLKNTFAWSRGREVIVSAHFGDLGNLSVAQQYQQAIEHYQHLYQFGKPQQIMVDTHQGYASHQLGQALAEQWQVPLRLIDHHHAHMAAVMAENHLPLGQSVIGLILDGLGMGQNHQLWGGECLVGGYATYEHFGGLPAVALPGGDQAAHQPWRNLLAQWQAWLPDWSTYWPSSLADRPYQILERVIEKNINAPLASSTGRLFDAIAAYLGINGAQIDYEGQAAIRLEQLAAQAEVPSSSLSMRLIRQDEQWQIDMAYFWQQWVQIEAPRAQLAWLFHDALAQGFAQLAWQTTRKHPQIDTVILAGGVLANQLLQERLEHYLYPLTVLVSEQFPRGDGALALGQIAIGAAGQRIKS